MEEDPNGKRFSERRRGGGGERFHIRKGKMELGVSEEIFIS